MRIARLHIYQHDLPVKDGPYTMAGQVVWALDTTIVRLVTDTGVEGWGEVCPLGGQYAPVTAGTVRAVLCQVAGALVGVPLEINAVTQVIDAHVLGQNYARAAIDIAVHDALGKVLGVSVATLLGGAYTDRVPSYYASGIGAPEDIARLAAEKLAEGYPRFQIKAGGRDVAEDIATIRKVNEVVGGDMRLAVDANRGLSQAQAIQLSRACADIPFLLEQPCNTIEEIAAIRAQLCHPVTLDESMVDLGAVLRVVGAGLADGFGMKISRIGGLRPFSAFRDICAARGLSYACDDSWGGDIVNAACIQMAAACPPRNLEGVWLAAPYIDGSFLAEDPVMIEAGHLRLRDGPGLGITPDADRVGRLVASFGG